MGHNWVWLGDHLAVDFVNTVLFVDGRPVELIGSVEEFNSWRAAVPAELPETDVDDRALKQVVAVRDSALGLLHAAAESESLSESDVDAINQAVRDGRGRRLIGDRVGADFIEADAGVEPLLGVLASAVVDLLAREDRANIAVCRAPGCGQVFHQSRPNQRWCSPGCGNRARVDRHRHRRVRPREQ